MTPSPSASIWRPFASAPAARGVTAVVLAATFVVFLLQAFPHTARGVAAVDADWHARMKAAEAPFALALAATLQVVGSAWVMVPLRLLVAAWLWLRARRARFALWVASSIACEGLALLLKALYGKARPADGLSPVVNTAFPSGHTATATSVAFGLLLVATLPGPRRRAFLPVALAWSLGMAWSRTYLRDHWLSDTIAGLLLGLASVLVTALVVDARLGAAPGDGAGGRGSSAS